jgi:hypothetical protein
MAGALGLLAINAGLIILAGIGVLFELGIRQNYGE